MRKKRESPNTSQALFLDYITQHPGKKQRDVANALGWKQDKVSRVKSAIDDLFFDGFVSKSQVKIPET